MNHLKEKNRVTRGPQKSSEVPGDSIVPSLAKEAHLSSCISKETFERNPYTSRGVMFCRVNFFHALRAFPTAAGASKEHDVRQKKS